MFGRKKRDRGEGFEEDFYEPEEYASVFPEEEDSGGLTDSGDSWAEEEEEPEEAEKPEKPRRYSIFRPEQSKPNFVISVLVHTIRVLILIVILA